MSVKIQQKKNEYRVNTALVITTGPVFLLQQCGGRFILHDLISMSLYW